ncbi:MAG TPA: hypothetical protein VMM55_10250 [Thermohalobaculum sp.]|nr:hypothetical protein [Thermohalobaculum sp.]
MAVIRINAARTGELMLAGGDPDWRRPIDAALAALPSGAPVTVVVHGYRYAPRADGRLGGPHCPHGLLYRADDIGPNPRAKRPPLSAWPHALGFREDGAATGLCIAFGWDARRGRGAALIDVGRNDFAAVYADAAIAGRALARIFGLIGRRRPLRLTSAMAHSLGARVVLRAMAERPDAAPGRVLLLGAAEYAGEARRLLADQDRGGRRRADLPEVLSVSSRANDFYDWLFELFAPKPRQRGDRPLGARGLGIPHLRWMDIELDHPDLARWLSAQGLHLTRLPERVTHWSFYSDPGAMLFWSRVLRGQPGWDLAGLRARRIPETRSARWSRMPQLLPRLRLRGGGVGGGPAEITQS